MWKVGRTGVGVLATAAIALAVGFGAGSAAGPAVAAAGHRGVDAAAVAGSSAWGGSLRSDALPDTAAPTVVLLHGLGRTPRSMEPLAAALEDAGYRVVNLGYPSRGHTVSELVDTVRADLARCCPRDGGPVHFVTHSLGGILVRAYAASESADRVGRVVMLSPPNHGTAVVDRLPAALLEAILGPAALQLGTGDRSVPLDLPPPRFELGIIAGEATLNPLFSAWLPGDDDGTVSVASARLDAAEDFVVVPYSHTFIMRRERVAEQVLSFLRTGSFTSDRPADGGR